VKIKKVSKFILIMSVKFVQGFVRILSILSAVTFYRRPGFISA